MIGLNARPPSSLSSSLVVPSFHYHSAVASPISRVSSGRNALALTSFPSSLTSLPPLSSSLEPSFANPVNWHYQVVSPIMCSPTSAMVVNPTTTTSSSRNKRNMMNSKYTRRKLRQQSPSSSSSSSSSSFQFSRGGALFPTTALGNAGKRSWYFLRSASVWKKIGIGMLIMLLLGTLTLSTLYIYHEGFRRTVVFWKGMGPILMKYKFLKFQHQFKMLSDETYEHKLHTFNVKAANDVTQLIQRMGGIYIKIGQVMSTVGQGLLPDEYTAALQPLQNGVSPKSFEEIKSIIETSTNKPLEESFSWFDPNPIGSASIAQAHRAKLRRSSPLTTASATTPSKQKRTQQSSNKKTRSKQEDDEGEEVIVKVQYPEVARLFEADLANMELVTKWIAPQNMPLVESLRKRHERELDFHIEASNLIECRTNMQRHGEEPYAVRIPMVRNETGLCTQHVLVMEYLRGKSLSTIITEEQDAMAMALGKANATELRSALAKQMRDHFERGGGPGDESIQGFLGGGGGGGSTSTTEGGTKSGQVAISSKKRRTPPPFVMNFMSSSLGGTLFRSYVKLQTSIRQMTNTVGSIVKGGNSSSKKSKDMKVNLSRILKTLVRVHGYQMLVDGVYNADPHPGNVLILEDGKTLGLLDYGMVGRLSEEDRLTISKTVLALAQGDKAATAEQYRSNGYSVTSSVFDKNVTDSNEVLHRFATLHLDKIDLSPIQMKKQTATHVGSTSMAGVEHSQKEGEVTVDTLQLLRSLQETRVPVWVEEARRLGGLLMGVSAQAARPISLAKQWEPIAKQSLSQQQ